jgi:acyl-coenzyme A thioesterase PaaI-like protein
MAPNRMSRSLALLERLPSPVRTRLRSLALGTLVPLVGTAGLAVEHLDGGRAVIRVANRRRVRNHIGGVHAAAMALVAETATGFVVGMNVPDDRVPVIKTLRVDFRKRARGSLRAEATLSEEQRRHIASTEKGETRVPVRVTDADGNEPIECEMVWAWTPRRR